jgi:hypothetical protein
MLELVFNAAWLTLGLFGLAAVLSAREDRSRRLIRVVAVACMLLVLFPVISLSDDLHSQAATLDDVSRSGDNGRVSFGAGHDASVAVTLASAADAVRLQFLHFADAAGTTSNPAAVQVHSSDALRAPPLA